MRAGNEVVLALKASIFASSSNSLLSITALRSGRIYPPKEPFRQAKLGFLAAYHMYVELHTETGGAAACNKAETLICLQSFNKCIRKIDSAGWRSKMGGRSALRRPR